MSKRDAGFKRMPVDAVSAMVAGGLLEAKWRSGGGPLTVCIDGKAASGKSKLAEQLKSNLSQVDQPVCVLEADWFLKARHVRMKALRSLKKDDDGVILVPTDHHQEYWNWDDLKKAVSRVEKLARSKKGGNLRLENLYDRQSGKCNGDKTIRVQPAAFILVAGSYLLPLRSWGVGIMLLVDDEEGGRRKRAREYRKKGEFPDGETISQVTSTWELIERPTFAYHSIRYGDNADVIIDTSVLDMADVIHFRLPPARAKSRRTRGIMTRPPDGLIKPATEDIGDEAMGSLQSGKGCEVIVAGDDRRLAVSLPAL